MTKIFAITASIITAVGVVAGAYSHAKQKVLRMLNRCDNMNVQFIRNWIASQNMPEYTSDYTAVYMRGKEIPNYSKISIFVNADSVVCLEIFDKKHKRPISLCYFLCSNIDRELGFDDFIEFTFEA